MAIGLNELKQLARRKWLRWSLEVALLVLVYLGLHYWQTRHLPAGPALPLEGVSLEGAPVSLAQLRGRPVLVHFWASWCKVCSLEESSIHSIARDHQVITVAMQSGSDSDVAGHMRANDLVFPVINDPVGQIAQRWRVRAVPATFIVDRHGAIRFSEVGYTSETGLRLRLWFAGLRAAGVPAFGT